MSEFQYLSGGNSEVQDKQATAYLLAASATTGVAASGVLDGLVVTQTASPSGSVLISAGAAVNQASLGQGADLLVNDTSKTLDVFTSNPVGGLPRNDIIVFDSVTSAIIVVVGTPNATPADPTVAATRTPLARLRHAASAPTIPAAKIDILAVPAFLRGVHPSAPYAQAAGLLAGFSAGTLLAGDEIHSTVTFPSGRFSVAPLVQATLQSAPGGSARLEPRVSNKTATNCVIYIYNTGATTATFSGLDVAWDAKQMTATIAAG